MDIQTPPGYCIKLVGDIQNESNPVICTNSNNDVNAQLSYLISLEQADGTSQVLHLTEEEAKCFGIYSNGTSDNTTTNAVNSTESIPSFVGDSNINPVKQLVKHSNKAVVRPKKRVNVRNSTVAVVCNDDSKEKQTEVNLHSYASPVLQANGKSQILQSSEGEGTAFEIFLNGASENGITNTVQVAKNVTASLVEPANANHIKHSMKYPNKTVIHCKKVNIRNSVAANIYSDNSQNHQQSKINLFSYSLTILQADGTSQILQLTEEDARALGIFSNGMPMNTGTNPFETTENAVTNSVEATNANCLKQPTKYSDKAITHGKKVVNIGKNLVENGYGDENFEEAQPDVNLLSYSSTILHTDEPSQLVQLSNAEARTLGMFSNGTTSSSATDSFETTKNTVTNPVNAANMNPVKRLLKHSNKTVPHRKEVNIRKKVDLDVCSNPKEKYTESIKPLGSCENPIEIIKDGEVLHSTQNLSQDYLQQIAEALHFKAVEPEKVEVDTAGDKSSNVIYRVVYPEELDLNPKPEKPLRRGRPKKRSYPNCSEKKPELLSEEPKPIKNMRTRSGRITRPPQHIKKDFKKIETSEVDNMETDLTTVEFEPLKTNQPPTAIDTPVKINQLESHQRKRSIAAQFRCPKCKKAYLGHSRMLKHLQKHPDHGPIPEHCKSRDKDTWNFFIDLCNKNPVGQRGSKFYKELVNFLHNARILAKILFKRATGLDKNLYFVDSDLSNMLGIESGNYVLSENELHKEVNMLSFVNSKCYSDANIDSGENLLNGGVKTQNESFDLDAFVQKCQTGNQNLNEISHENLDFIESNHCNTLNSGSNNDFNHKLDLNDLNKNSKSSATLDGNNFHQNKFSFDTIQSSEHNDFSLHCDITSVRTFNTELQKFDEHIVSDFTDRTVNESCERKSARLDMSNSTAQAREQNNHEKSENPDLSLHSELLSDSSLLNSLPNLRTSVEELILNNVDSTQVTNLLDNSTSSDEVMNVDQFVNERFKNLTESDLELPNTSLNLDLPSLDLFQFHTS